MGTPESTRTSTSSTRGNSTRTLGPWAAPRHAARIMGVGAVAGLVLLSGCSGSTDPGKATGTTVGSGGFTAANAPIATPNLQLVSALEPFTACDQLLDYVKKAAVERVGPYGFSNNQRFSPVGNAIDSTSAQGSTVPTVLVPTGGPATTVMSEQPRTAQSAAPGAASTADQSSTKSATANSSAGQGDASAGAPAHSETNVQEQGVDEPDTIKTDGKRILALTGNRLIEVNVEAAAPQTVGSISLPGNGATQILVSGNHVLAINNDPSSYDSRSRAGASVAYQSTPSTLLSIIDIADPANMKILHSTRVDGSFVSARMVDGQARVVTTSAPGRLAFVNPSNGSPAAQDAATKANKQIVQDSKIEDWLPVMHVGNGSTPTDKPLLECAKLNHPKTFSGFGTLSVLSVDVTANEVNPADAVGIMADGQTVYASKASLYVSTPAYVEPPRPVTGGTTPSTVAPAPIPLKTTTSIHKFDISAKGPAVYRASGDVEGTLLSQFSLSEDGGFLRVATTTSPSNCGRCSSSQTIVRVLQEANGELTQVGQVGDMGHGEQIKAVRFVGKQGYVVTFRQTDPLYTLDLSNPTTPKVAGELKLLGYSAYLHPAGDNLLIGIGQDATGQGRTLGTKVALFDMSDLANPRELQQYVLWNSTSQVEQDFHAFNFWGPTKLAVIPVNRAYVGYIGGNCPVEPIPATKADPTSNSSSCQPQTYIPPFTGAIGLTIDRNGISELGRIVNPGSAYTPVPECQRTGQCIPSPCPTDAKCTGIAPVSGTIPQGKGPAAIDCSANPCTSQTAATPVPVTPTTPTTLAPLPGTPGVSVPSPRAPMPPCYQPPGVVVNNSGGTSSGPSPYCPIYNGDLGSPIERSVVVGDTLFTFSNNGLKSSELSTLHEKYWLPFF